MEVAATTDTARDAHRRRSDLKIAIGLALAPMLLMTPIGSVLVFQLGYDRGVVANAMCLLFIGSFYAALAAPWLPLPSLAKAPPRARVQITCFIWFFVAFSTAASWDLIWLLFTDAIRNAHDKAWAYTWWAWIDGGDRRYAGFDPVIVALECQTITLGALGGFALWRWYRAAHKPDIIAVLILMFTAAGHLYGTCMYYLAEILGGFPHINLNSLFDVIVKFVLINSPWVVMPIVVLIWGTRTIIQQASPSMASGSNATRY